MSFSASLQGAGAHFEGLSLRLAEKRVLAGGPFRCASIGDRQHRLDRGEGDGAVALKLVERPGRGEALERLLVDQARIEAVGHVAERGERTAAACQDQRLGLRVADALERAQRINDRWPAVGADADVEIDIRGVGGGRGDFDPEPFGLCAEFGEFVGIALVERHRGGEEFRRMVGLEPGGLVGDESVRRGMRLVEAVFGEFGAGVENGVGRRPWRRRARPRR